MNIINLLKNKFDRILTKKEVIIVAVVIIPLMIGAAVLFSNKAMSKTNIVLITQDDQKVPQNDRFNISIMKEKPDLVSLLMGKYDVIVEEKSTGSYEVTVVMKNKNDKEIIENFFNYGQSLDGYESVDLERGLGTKVVGFIIMVVIMQGVALTILYPEDRQLKTFRRILTAPVNEKEYLLAQGIFTFVCLYIPTYLAISIAKVFFGVKMGFSLGMLAILVAIITALTTSFALFISAVLEENQSLAATGIATITCLLAGCFNYFTTNNKVVDTILSILPQKAYMTLLSGIEKGSKILDFRVELIYLIAWIIVLWLLGSFISKRKMNKGIY